MHMHMALLLCTLLRLSAGQFKAGTSDITHSVVAYFAQRIFGICCDHGECEASGQQIDSTGVAPIFLQFLRNDGKRCWRLRRYELQVKRLRSAGFYCFNKPAYQLTLKAGHDFALMLSVVVIMDG